MRVPFVGTKHRSVYLTINYLCSKLVLKAPRAEARFFMVPYQRNPHFTGHDELLDQLWTKLVNERPNQCNHRVALYGLGGVGKTQVALEYVYRHKRDYKLIVWIEA